MGLRTRKDTRRPIAGEVGISWQDADGQIQFTNVKGVDLRFGTWSNRPRR